MLIIKLNANCHRTLKEISSVTWGLFTKTCYVRPGTLPSKQTSSVIGILKRIYMVACTLFLCRLSQFFHKACKLLSLFNI